MEGMTEQIRALVPEHLQSVERQRVLRTASERKRMHLDSAFVLAKLSPLEHRQTKVDGCGVKGIDMTVKLEDFLYPSLAGFRNHVEGELLEDVVIALLVSLAKIAPCHGFADAEMVEFSRMCFHRHNKIAQTFTI